MKKLKARLVRQYLITTTQTLLFKNFEQRVSDYHQLNELLDGKIKYVKPNEIIAHKDNQLMYLVLSGKAITEDNFEVTSGSFIGEFTAICNLPQIVVKALNHMVIMELDAKKNISVINKYGI